MNVLLAAEYYFANPDFVRLGNELAQKNHNVFVLTSFRTVDRGEREESVKIFETKPFVSIYAIPHTLSFPVSKIQKIVKTHGIEVIHAINDHSTNVAAASLVAKAAGIPLVYTIQGPGTRTGHFLVDSLVATYDLTVERWIAREAGKVILLSESLASTADKLRILKSKVVVIQPGVDTSHFDPESPEAKEKATKIRKELNIGDELVIGFVGRLVQAKGLTYLFSALKQIEDAHPKVSLLIVGDGAQRNELQTLSRQLKMRTIFAGWQNDVLPYYALMDIFVLPSLFEGLPNVILEAMAMRTAVVATSVGGNLDVLSNGENGFLVQPRSVSRLALALEKLVEDDKLRTQMGIANRRKVERCFQWSSSVKKVEMVYSELA